MTGDVKPLSESQRKRICKICTKEQITALESEVREYKDGMKHADFEFRELQKHNSELVAEVARLTTELSDVRREAVFAVSKAQTGRSQQIYDEAELSGYSRGVADTEENLKESEAARLTAENQKLKDALLKVNDEALDNDKKLGEVEARVAEAQKVMVDFHCSTYEVFPNEELCGSPKTKKCQRYYSCDAMKKALGGEEKPQ